MPAHILVADDDQNVRIALAKYIRRLGYTVVEAASGEEALQMLSDPAEPSVDLLLTDIWMPAMSGVELLQAAHQINPDLPVAMITGAATLDSSIAALNAGAYAYLVKPIRNEQVRDVLGRGLRQSEKIRESQALQQDLLAHYQALEQRLLTLQERRRDMSRVVTGDLLAELIRGLRHELGNVTTAIKLNLSVLEEEGDHPVNLHEHLHDLEVSTDHLIGLLGKLREYPKETLVTELIDLRQLLLALPDVARDKIERQKVQLDFSMPDQEVLIQGTPKDLNRAFLHILENAIEASDQIAAPHVRIWAVVGDHNVEVAISDDGPGFPGDVSEEPFSPGYTTKMAGGMMRGLGLGLFLARAIISLHNGCIWLENQAEGGATVHVQLPLARPG
jgi:signal transduction histidine kinase